MEHTLPASEQYSSATTLQTEQERKQRFGHTNPIDESEISDDERGDLLEKWLSCFEDEFGKRPMLMPLDEEGKPVPFRLFKTGVSR